MATELDAHQEFLYEIVQKCNRCGYCQEVCPLYNVTGLERSVARGHAYHLRGIIEGRMPLSTDVARAFSECLLCKACVGNCLADVDTEKIVVAAREAYWTQRGRPLVQRIIFRHLLTSPKKMMYVLRLAYWVKSLRFFRLRMADRLLQAFLPALAHAAGFFNHLPKKFLVERLSDLPLHNPAATHPVAYFVGCAMNFVFPDAAEATLRVLHKLGYDVEVVNNVCCGLPAYSNGDIDSARNLARLNLAVFANLGVEAIVTECASCSSFLKEYQRLLKDDPIYGSVAQAFSAKIKDTSELIARQPMPRLEAVADILAVTYHDPCHLHRYQKIREEPRSLLQAIPGLLYRELPEAGWCCGGAGSFNITHPEESAGVLARKMANVAKTGTDTLVTSCPGCMIQLEYGIRLRGLDIKVVHLNQLLDRALPVQDHVRRGDAK